MYYYILPTDKDLQHHGVLGMKWGVRRYQNKDGSLTSKGKQRYGINNKSGVTGFEKRKNLNTNKNGTSKREQFSKYSNLREVNKIYKDTDNCSLCTFAMDLRNRGYDVRAGGKGYLNDGKSLSEISSWYKGGRQPSYNESFFNLYSNRTGTLVRKPDNTQFINEVLYNGEGTSGHMFFQNVYEGTALGGHDAFYEVEDGVIYIYDAQIGTRMPLDEYMEKYKPISLMPYSFLRTDDLEPNVDAMTTSEGGLYVLTKKKESFNVAEKTHTAKYNYSPPNITKVNPQSPLNYNPPYKSRSEFNIFKENANRKLKETSKKLKNTSIKIKKGLKAAGNVALAIADVSLWLLNPYK